MHVIQRGPSLKDLHSSTSGGPGVDSIASAQQTEWTELYCASPVLEAKTHLPQILEPNKRLLQSTSEKFINQLRASSPTQRLLHQHSDALRSAARTPHRVGVLRTVTPVPPGMHRSVSRGLSFRKVGAEEGAAWGGGSGSETVPAGRGGGTASGGEALRFPPRFAFQGAANVPVQFRDGRRRRGR